MAMPFIWNKTHSWVLFFCALIGLTASVALTYDTYQLANTAGYVPSCSINPILSCGSVMKSDAASLIGAVPNSAFGIVGFFALLIFSVLLILGKQFSKRIWTLGLVAASIGFLLVHYLIFESLFILQTLCPWCMSVWLVSLPIFGFFLLKYLSLRETQNEFTETIIRHRVALAVLWYGAVLTLVINELWYYWQTLLPF